MPRAVEQTGISADIWVDKKASNKCVSSNGFTSLICLTEHYSSVGFCKLSSYTVGLPIFVKLDFVFTIEQLEFKVVFKIQKNELISLLVSIHYS